MLGCRLHMPKTKPCRKATRSILGAACSLLKGEPLVHGEIGRMNILALDRAVRGRVLLILTCLIFTDSSFAQQDADETDIETSAPSRSSRQKSAFVAHLIPLALGTWVPTKRGVSLGWVVSADTTIDAEYLRGAVGIDFQGIELAQFKEEVMTVGWRSFMGTNSFNLRPSLGARRYTLTAGDRLLAQVTGQQTENTLLQITTYVAGLAIGNRWQFGNGFTLGVDWFEIVVPILQKHESHPVADGLSDPDTQRTADRIGQLLRNAPTFAVAKMNVGWTF